MSDQGLGVHFFHPKLFEKICRIRRDVKVETISPSQIYKVIMGEAYTPEEKALMLDPHFNMRHGSHSILRNIARNVTKVLVEASLTVRQALESIGCNKRAIIAADFQGDRGVINVPKNVLNTEMKK